MKKIAMPLAIAATVLLSGCGLMNKKTINTADLVNHNYFLVTMNGQTFKGKEPTLKFNDQLVMSASVCNRFTGKVELKNNQIKAKNIASTRMMCTDSKLNSAEQAFSDLVLNGAKVSVDGMFLTLTNGKNTFVYRINDRRLIK